MTPSWVRERSDRRVISFIIIISHFIQPQKYESNPRIAIFIKLQNKFKRTSSKRLPFFAFVSEKTFGLTVFLFWIPNKYLIKGLKEKRVLLKRGFSKTKTNAEIFVLFFQLLQVFTILYHLFSTRFPWREWRASEFSFAVSVNIFTYFGQSCESYFSKKET